MENFEREGFWVLGFKEEKQKGVFQRESNFSLRNIVWLIQLSHHFSFPFSIISSLLLFFLHFLA